MKMLVNKSTILSFFVIVAFIVTFTIENSFATIALMTDDDLSCVDGQLSEIRLINHNQVNDTVRIFLDIHQEAYGKIDSFKAGYYYRDTSELTNTPIQIGISGFEGFYHGVDNVNNGANFQFLRVLSDFNTMAPQNGATLEPWGNGGYDEKDKENTTTPNCNHFDWDLWIDNLQLGESPDKPQIVNGLIVRLEFDKSITGGGASPNLERLVVGSNGIEGNMYINPQRLTGTVSPLLLSNSTNRSAGAKDPYEYLGANVMLRRDPLIQCFGVATHNVEDRDTGAWLTVDFTGDHLQFSFIAGHPENAIDFHYTGGAGSTGFEGIDLWDAGWAPCGDSGMVGTDPYHTVRQENYEAEK